MFRLTSASCLLLAIFILGMVHESRSCQGLNEECVEESECCDNRHCCGSPKACINLCFGKRLGNTLKDRLAKH
uniref:Ubs_04 putative toxin n=1 Tax=Unedogemmula bisaya TaxID=746885 RepID=A0A098LWK3_UNEBI